MNWNEWRGFCSESGLSQEEARESWGIYKNLVSEAEGAAIYPFLEGDDQEAMLDAAEDLPHLHNPTFAEREQIDLTGSISDPNPFINELINFQEQLNERLSEKSDDELDEETDADLMESTEECYLHLLKSLEHVRNRIEYYHEQSTLLTREAERYHNAASLLTREAEDAVGGITQAIRRSMDD